MTGASTATILIVDDDEAKRYSITKILQKAGFTTREGMSGADALRLVSEMPDLVILDVKLPDISGFEVCRRIKADAATATIPVLHVSTTFVDLEDKVQGLEVGADGYLTDVVEPLELLATVRALLRARRAEEAAQISSRQWQTTFDAVNDGVMLLDRDGKVMQVNQAAERILARPWNELIGHPFHELMGTPEGPDRSPFARMLGTRSRVLVELTLGGRWLRAAVDPVRNRRGDVNGALCIVSDVTDRRQMEEELRRRAEELAAADRRKDEFLAMLAHELRNPLAPILNCLELIRREGPAGAGIGQSLGIAERQVKHMARLLDDLLDVSRFTAGKIQLRRRPLELATVLTHAVETAAPMLEAKGHRLTLELPDRPIGLLGDPTRLEQVVANLLNNAAKYTEPGGQITLSAGRQGDEAVVTVVDSGIGLTEEMKARVFDLFAQADLSLDRSQGGLGIGLTLVRGLVELHGGRVGVDSPGLGHGSVFTVHLPVSRDLPAQAAEPAATVARPADEHLRILVVDDHRDSALSLGRMLRSWGHQFAVAHDGPTAIGAATEAGDPFDLVLLDIGLPGMDGYEVAARLREEPGLGGLILVALSGYGQEQDIRRSESVGFDRHLVKPVMPETLHELLANLEGLSGRPRAADASDK